MSIVLSWGESVKDELLNIWMDYMKYMALLSSETMQ